MARSLRAGISDSFGGLRIGLLGRDDCIFVVDERIGVCTGRIDQGEGSSGGVRGLSAAAAAAIVSGVGASVRPFPPRPPPEVAFLCSVTPTVGLSGHLSPCRRRARAGHIRTSRRPREQRTGDRSSDAEPSDRVGGCAPERVWFQTARAPTFDPGGEPLARQDSVGAGSNPRPYRDNPSLRATCGAGCAE
jgi:hypothetical protein